MAYVKAIATKSGYSVHFNKEQYKVDGVFKQIVAIDDQYEESGFPLDFELKSTINYTIENNDVIYNDFEVKNYNQLVRRSQDKNATAQILILYCLPRDDREWLHISDNELILKKMLFLASI